MRDCFVGLFVVFLACFAVTDVYAGDEKPLTFSDLKARGIVQFVGREFLLKAKVQWDDVDLKIPEDPTPIAEIRKLAGRLKVPFDELKVKGRGKKYLWATGPGLGTVKDEAGKEQYAFKKKLLSNNDTEYTLKVRLKLRSGFNANHLKNPAFIKQSNNPRYWAQTFELEIVAIQGL